jgi:hypothetical protein
VAGCAVNIESAPEDVGIDEAGLKGSGCKIVCPKCHGDDPCPLRPCVLECKPGHTKCGDNVCAKDEFCCNESCGICAPEGGFCTQQLCQPSAATCGNVTCGAGEFCCNESCSICAPEGGFCTQQLCQASGAACGAATCAEGEVCCNASCGICTPPDGMCTQQVCL